MNRDILLGVVVSLALHLIATNPFAAANAAPKPPVKPKDVIVEWVMPPIVDEKEPRVTDLPNEVVENVLAPPKLADVPSVMITDFVEPLEPPRPADLKVDPKAIRIPKTTADPRLHGERIWDPINLDQRPVARLQPGPQYPYEMSRIGASGEVVIEFIINASGDVIQTQVVKSTHREFELPAMQAVQKWKFKPGRKGGKAVNTRVTQAIEFNLEDAK